MPALATDQDIYERIYTAILDRRLQPGAHLREAELAGMFGVGRTKVRQALAKLAETGAVEVQRNRGASVTAPSRQQAAQVFDLRDMLEPAIAARLAERHTPDQLVRLRMHIAQEDAARVAGDEAALIRRTGEFHLILAELLGNPHLDRLLRGLEALTCLSILSYARTASCACLPDEHYGILRAVAESDPDEAHRLMTVHLIHVRAELDLDDRPEATQALSDALGLTELHRPGGS